MSEPKQIRIHPSVHQDLSDLARERGINMLRLASMLLAYGIEAMKNGQVEVVEKLEPSTDAA